MHIVDSNVLFGFWPRRRLDATLEAVMAAGTAHGMARQIVCCARGVFHDFVRGNDETLRACAGSPRLAPAATVNPLRALDSASEIDRMAEAGVRVFRFFPEHQGWDYRLRAWRGLLRRLCAAGGVAMTSARVGGHLEAGAVSQLLATLEDTGAPCVLTGVYYGNLGEVLDAACAYSGLYIETDLLNGPDSLEVAASAAGAGRLIYGSGAPLQYVDSSLLPLQHCGLHPAAKEDVAGRNVARLLGWPV